MRSQANQAKTQLANVPIFGKSQRALRPHSERARSQPQGQLVQHDAGQEYDVVENSRDLDIIGQQPADLKNVLMQPAFDLAK